MKSDTSLSDRISAFFYSADEQLIALELIKFMKKDFSRKHPEGFKGLKHSQVIRVIQRKMDEKHSRVYDIREIESVITQLKSYGIIHSKDENKVETNRHYSLDKSYINGN